MPCSEHVFDNFLVIQSGAVLQVAVQSRLLFGSASQHCQTEQRNSLANVSTLHSAHAKANKIRTMSCYTTLPHRKKRTSTNQSCAAESIANYKVEATRVSSWSECPYKSIWLFNEQQTYLARKAGYVETVAR